MILKKIICLLIMTLFVTGFLNAKSKYFTGEVYKKDKYKKQIVCRGSDLTSIKNGMTLYICDENNKQVAAIKVTRYYTTVIEAKLVSGKSSAIRIKMPVYSHKSQFYKKKPIKIIRYEKNYENFNWLVEIYYKKGKKIYKTETSIKIPKIIKLLAKGSDRYIKISTEEIKSLILTDMNISAIKLKDGELAELKKINFKIDPKQIPEFRIKTKLTVKEIKRKNAFKIDLIERKEGDINKLFFKWN